MKMFTLFNRAYPVVTPVFLGMLLCFISWSALATTITNDEAATKINKELNISVLANDGLGDDALILKAKALNGEAVIAEGSKAIKYTPKQNFIGLDHVTYTAAQAGQEVGEGTLLVTVEGGIDELLTQEEMARLGKVLFAFLIIALLLEFALDRIYDFRWFIRYLEGRGLKLPVAVGVALLLIVPLDLDLVSAVATILTGEHQKSWWLSYVLSALIVSGGSATIFRLYKALGLRSPIPGLSDAEKERDFGRVRISVERDESERSTSKGKKLEVYIGGVLYGVIDADSNEYPPPKMPSLPVRTGDREISVAISPRMDGDQYWTRHIGIAKFYKITVPFDLCRPANAKVRPDGDRHAHHDQRR